MVEILENLVGRRHFLKSALLIPTAVYAIATADEAIAPNYAFAQTRTDEVTAPVRVEELSDLVASATLNGPDTVLLSWTPTGHNLSEFEAYVKAGNETPQRYVFTPIEKDGKMYALLGGVNGRNGETLSIEVKGNGAGVIAGGKAIMQRPIVLDVENAEWLTGEDGSKYKQFSVSIPSPKPDKLWGYFESVNKEGSVTLKYGRFGGDLIVLDDLDYEIGENYVKKLLNTSIIPEGQVDILIFQDRGAKIRSVTISNKEILSYQMSSILPQPTAVSPSTWGQIKSQYK